MLYIILGLIVGLSMPVQTSVNAKAREALRSPYLSALVTFIIGAVGTAIVLLVTGGTLSIPFGAIAEEPWWIWTGGFCGASLIVLCIYCMPKLGSVETMVMLVLGQIVVGLVVDTFGLFRTEQLELTPSRLIGSILVLAGTIAVSKSNAGESSGVKEATKGIWLYRLEALTAGSLAGVQIAVNGRLGVVVGDSMRATLISMTVGCICALVMLILARVIGGRKAVFDDTEKITPKWWMFTGGALSVIIVGGNAIIATALGTGVSVLLNVAGQTGGGVLIDAAGFLGIEKKPITVSKVLALIVMIIGIMLVSVI